MKPIKHLLVIRLSAMGDVAMAVPVLSEFCKRYPDIRITVLTKEFFKPLFSELPNAVVYSAEVKGKHKGLLGLFRLYKELKALKIDAVADIHNVLRSTILKYYFKLGGIKFVQIDKGRGEKRALTSPGNKVFKPLKTSHQRYADVFDELGYPLNLADAKPLPKKGNSKEVLSLFNLEARINIGIAPFAAFEGKMYPIHLMEEVICQLDGFGVYNILLFGGGKKELEQLSQWESRYQNVNSASEKLSFNQELDLIASLDVMLAMDSGNGHLSAMYGVPTVTLWGVTHPHAGFAPFAQKAENWLMADRQKFPLIPTSIYGNKMPDGYEKAMETILPEKIVEKIRLLTTSK